MKSEAEKAAEAHTRAEQVPYVVLVHVGYTVHLAGPLMMISWCLTIQKTSGVQSFWMEFEPKFGSQAELKFVLS